MSRSKKIFAILAAVFVVLLGIASYDISRRTTFPGSKSQLPERIKGTYLKADSTRNDTIASKMLKD